MNFTSYRVDDKSSTCPYGWRPNYANHNPRNSKHKQSTQEKVSRNGNNPL